MTLVELLVAIGIAFAVLGSLVYGYIQAYRVTDSATLQSAAHRLVVDRLDTVRLATWRNHGTTNEVNELPRFGNTMVSELELPLLTTNRVLASLTTEVQSLGANPPLFRIQVVCVWTNLSGQVFTNSLTTLRAPD
jgi:type II secretory pathway pseudopilin PulG